MRYSQVVNLALGSYVARERYTRKNTSCANSSAVEGLWHMRYKKPIMGRRYFWIRYENADSSPLFTRSMTSTSETASRVFAMGAEADCEAPETFASPRPGIPPCNNPRSNTPRPMATLLTLVETPSEGESCASSGSGGGAEVFSRESVTGRGSGMSEAGMKRRWKEAIGSGRGGQEAPQAVKEPSRLVYAARTRIQTTG